MDSKSLVESLLKDSGIKWVDGSLSLDQTNGNGWYDLNFYADITTKSGIDKIIASIKENTKQQFKFVKRDKYNTTYYACHLSDNGKGTGKQVFD